MKLSALEIKKQEFKKTLRGYDTIEVKSFLDVLASQWENLVTENREFSYRISELETQLKDFRQVEKVMHQTMLNAEETSKQTIENAKHTAQNLIKEAELNSQKITDQTRSEMIHIQSQLNLLEAQKNDLINRMKVFLDVSERNLANFEHNFTIKSDRTTLPPSEEPELLSSSKKEAIEPQHIFAPINKDERMTKEDFIDKLFKDVE